MIVTAIGLLILLCLCMYIVAMRTKKKLHTNQLILDLSLQLSSTVDRRTLLSLIMDKTTKILKSEAASIILMDQDSGELYFEVATGEDSDNVKRIRLPAGQGIAGWVQLNGQSVLINDVSKDSRWNRTVSDSSTIKTRNMLCTPILSNGVLLGVIQVINKEQHRSFKRDELKLLEQLSSPIAMSLENMMLYEALRHSMDSLRETTATKEKILSEMRLAKEIQLSLLPGEQFTYGKIQINATLLPAREVGGDFYHFFALDEEHILICLGDVSDKGMPAALFMSALMIWIKAKASSDLSIHEIVYAINQELSTDTSTMFATLFIAILNSKTGEMTYCDAGHCPVYVLSKGNLHKLETAKGLPIGVMPNMTYSQLTYQLTAQDQLILYTDGIIEAENKEARWYGEQRLEHYIQASSTTFNVQGLLTDVQAFADAPQSDDIAIMHILFDDIT